MKVELGKYIAIVWQCICKGRKAAGILARQIRKAEMGSELLNPFCLTDQSLESCALWVFCVLNYNIWQGKKLGFVFDPRLKQTEKIP